MLKLKQKFRALIDLVENTELQDSIRKELVNKLTDEHWLRGCYFQIKNINCYITNGFSKKQKDTYLRDK